MKFLFLPFSIAVGLIAGQIGKKIFDGVWRLFDDEEAPEAAHKEIPIVKLVLALTIEGAIFRVVKGLTDHHARRAFYNVTGTWPGEEEPDQA